ncbi:alpha/beta fold hydrolase [Allokutzneria sp. NRRL B-24872]|uniref:alpha/beta fold hydrolase n=1 Tax=Allokutzneria sp. NRRL B-24872 TaxID=1137961 RepID=UPI000A3758AD|nr:alpha/beta hydrolase [Allokutzneria sp. NRRL B-24872]
MEEIEIRLPRAGITLRGRRFGTPGGLPVLCLHGWLDNCASFAPMASRLPGFDLVAVDLPGHGLSDPIPSPTCQYLDHVACVLELAQVQGWQRLQLVGHSLGGALSALVAGVAPSLVERLVLIDAIGPLSASPDVGVESVSRYLSAYLADEPAPVYRTRSQALKARVQLADILLDTAELLLERDVREVPGGFSWRSDNRLRHPFTMTFTEEQVRAYLSAITAPVLFAEAERTALREDYYPGRLAAVPNLTKMTFAGGHHLHVENPDPVAEAVRDFLRS